MPRLRSLPSTLVAVLSCQSVSSVRCLAFTSFSVASTLSRLRSAASASTGNSAASSGKCINKQSASTFTSTNPKMSNTGVAEFVTQGEKKKLEDLSESYGKLITKLRAITQLNRVESVLNYDRLVFMPHNDKSSAERGAQLAALAGLIHEKATEKELFDLIEKSEADLAALGDNASAFADEVRLLEIEKKQFIENERVSPELAGRKAALESKAYSAWVKARQSDDFSSFAPTLAECFNLAKEVADAKRGGEASGVPLYTQMLDEFEVGMSKERIDEVFDEVKNSLVPLISKVLASPNAPSTAALKGTFPVAKQKEICERIVKSVGYDAEYGRIDVSVHPFTSSSSPSDVRITSRFSEDEWYQGLAGTVHEGGHAMYEQHLKPSALSIDKPLSMGTHESQSLFWERHIGLSKPYWRWAAPILQEVFGDFDHTPEELYGAVNAVSPSLIRVEADELTYPLHIILRYNIERDVIGGYLSVEGIPQRWKDDMKELLDVDVPSDAMGCLQDIHWSALAFGYFPTYLIGSSTAAQLAHYCRLDIPDMEEKIERGDVFQIREWLTEKVHRHGSRYKSLDALLEDQLGEKLNPKYFIEYLTTKYSELYKC